MKPKNIAFVLFCSFLFTQNNKEIDGIAAIVENNIILKSDLLQMVSMTAAQNKVNIEQNPDLYEKIQKNILKSMIDQKVLLEMAILDSIVIEEEEVNQSLDQQIDNLILQSGGKESAERVLGQSIKDFRREFWFEMQDRLITERYQQTLLNDIKVTREDVMDFLLTYKDSLPIEPTKFQVRHLLRKIKPSEKAITETTSRLNEIKESIVLGNLSFSESAQNYSEDVGSKNKGGSLGWVKRGSLVKNFETVAFTLNLNDISDPVETEFGFHLIETLEKKGDKIKVRHILLIPPKTQEDTERTFNFIKALETDSIKTLQDFKFFVDKYSDDEPTKKVGGSLGWIDPLNYSVEEIGKSMKYLEKDICSPPINSNLGIHLLWIENIKKGGVLNLRDHYPKIEELALNLKKMKWYNNWIKKAQEDFYIEIKSY